MLRIGQINKLRVLRETSVGMFLGDAEGNDVLLPLKYVPEDTRIDDFLDVFIYRDSEDRVIATTLTPEIKLNDFGVLRVREVNDIGAFLEWNIEKDILVPFNNQLERMQAGKLYPVYLYLDEKTERIVASSRLYKFLNNDTLTVKVGDEVEITLFEATDLGYKVMVNKRHQGLLYHNEIFEDVYVGMTTRGYVKSIRPDNKIDLTLHKQGFYNIDSFTEKILNQLEKEKGFLPLHDKSNPEDIIKKLGMSKNQFKKSAGVLYKAKKITIGDDGIRLAGNQYGPLAADK